MAEKEIAQRKAAEPEAEQQNGKSMSPPAFQLMAGDAGDGAGTGNGGGGTIQKKDEKDTKAGQQNQQASGGYNTHVGTNAIVTIPKGATGVLPILVVVGGKNPATKEWMKAEMPANFFSTHIISFSNYGTLYVKGVKPEIEAAMAKDNVKGSYKALLGFSAGGYRIEGAKNDEKWALLGMIDPVVTNGATYPCPAYMVWTNWYGANDARKKLHERFVKKEVDGQSIEGGPVADHLKMPKLWFKTYGSML
jgi:hypothetical protein